MGRRSLSAIVAAVGVVALLLPQAAQVASAGSKPGNNRKVWRNVSVPFSSTFQIPKGTTLVKASAKVAGGSGVGVALTNADTLRPRCYAVLTKTWSSSITGSNSCDALTAVDRPGAIWKIDVTGGATTATSVTVEFVKGKVRGQAGKLNLNKLSMPQFKMSETKDFMLESFDGTLLHAEITRPITNKKVPVVVISSPYFAGAGPYSPDLINDWGPRGYAILSVDVRGFNQSAGCVEVWGPNEQQDQKAIVEWAAKQPWSDGRVAMVGKSYVGTTPLEGAVMAPKALKAVIAIAPVASAYDDWHFGGVPNGEQVLSPLVGYQALEGANPDPGLSDPLASILNSANGLCDPTLSVRASDPRAIYDNFYVERDFGARAKDIKAAVLYSHGYEDSNVKIAVANEFLNELKTPHLGLFGHWDHIWPPRADSEVLFLAWIDQYLKGKDIGLARLPNALVENNLGRERGFESWPTPKAKRKELHLDFGGNALTDKATAGQGQLLLESAGTGAAVGGVESVMRFEQKLKKSLELGGVAKLAIKGTLAGAENGHVAAFLYDSTGATEELITFGMFNLAHRNGHDKYEPVTPTETIKAELQFLTNNHVFKAGHTLVLEVRAARPTDFGAVSPSETGVLTLESGANATRLIAPTL